MNYRTGPNRRVKYQKTSISQKEIASFEISHGPTQDRFSRWQKIERFFRYVPPWSWAYHEPYFPTFHLDADATNQWRFEHSGKIHCGEFDFQRTNISIRVSNPGYHRIYVFVKHYHCAEDDFSDPAKGREAILWKHCDAPTYSNMSVHLWSIEHLPRGRHWIQMEWEHKEVAHTGVFTFYIR